MRLRLFRAAGMGEAMALLRAELGTDAVILETRRVAGGVEVTAALDGRDDPVALPADDEPLVILPGPPPLRSAALPPALAWHNLPAGLTSCLAGNPATLAARLAEALRFAAMPDPVRQPVLLVGPPGAGKTLSCAKLATRGVLAGGAPLVITTDGARAGAPEQLAAFTRLLGLPLAIAPQPPVLTKALLRRGPGQAVLIDTAGCDPRDASAAAAIGDLAKAAGALLLVVLPAGLDADEAGELAEAFYALGARHLLPTRLDGAARLGGILGGAAAGLALTEAGTSASPAEGGLTPIDAAWLAARLLTPKRPLAASNARQELAR